MTDKEWDKLLNIKTSGRDATNADTYRYPYEPTGYAVLNRLADEGLIGKADTLLDYGCGKGRVDIFLAYQTKCSAIGVEYDERIYEKALENLRNCVCKRRISFVHTDAGEYEVAPEINRIFFFNPFSVELLKSIMNNILQSYYDSPREIMLFFYYPSDEYIAYLSGEDRLEFYDEIDCKDLFHGNDIRERIMIFTIG